MSPSTCRHNHAYIASGITRRLREELNLFCLRVTFDFAVCLLAFLLPFRQPTAVELLLYFSYVMHCLIALFP